MSRLRQRARLGVVAAASFVLLVLVLPQFANGIGLGGLAHRMANDVPCASSGSGSGSMGSGSGGSSGSSGSSSMCTPPTLTATPDSGLVDGQTIAVTGTDFGAFSGAGIVECEESATSALQCDIGTLSEVGTDGSGSFATTYTVSRIISITEKGGTQKSINCGVARCALGAADLSNLAADTKTSISFLPHSPLAFRATVAAIDAVNTKTGVAEISGTVTCTQADTVNIYLELQQRYRRFNFSNYGQTTVPCRGRTTWTVAVPPALGLFGAGDANVQAEISTQVGTAYRNINITRNVTLQAIKKTK